GGSRGRGASPAPLVASPPRGQGRHAGDGGSGREGRTMSAITLQIPEDLDLALNVAPDALAPALLVAAAVKLFELGKISAGEGGGTGGDAQAAVSRHAGGVGGVGQYLEC